MALISTSKMLDQETTALFGDPRARATLGLALSGGGIRSATFGLGFLQGLAKLGLLTSIDYLSTVSGGGYIGCWLSAWTHRHPEGIEGVMRELKAAPSADPSALYHEPAAVHHLRRFSNYLAPRVGLLSADTWSLAATFVRNLLINWLTLVPYFALVVLLPILVTDFLYGLASEPTGRWQFVQTAVYTPEVVRRLGFASLLLLAISIAMLNANLPGSRSGVPVRMRRKAGAARSADEDGQGITDGGFLVGVLAPLALAALGLATYWFLIMTAPAHTIEAPSWRTLVGVGAGVHLLGLAIYAALVLRRKGTDRPLRLARDRTAMALDLVAVVLSGTLAGWLVWILGTTTLDAVTVAIAGLTSLDTLPAYVATFVVLGIPMLFGALLLAMTLYVGLASRGQSDDDREWYARAGAWTLIVSLGWLCLAALAQFGPLVIASTSVASVTAGLNVVSGVVTWWLGRSAATSGAPGERSRSRKSEVVLAVACTVFVIAFTLLIAFGLMRTRDYLAAVNGWQPITATLAVAGGLLCLIALMTAVNTNVFSLHGMYRDRLIRAYLGASRNGHARDRFTGFDPDDNVPLAYLAPPFFSVREWRQVQAIAAALERAGKPDKGVEAELIAATSRTADEHVPVERLIERWNDALSRSGDPESMRRRLDELVEHASVTQPIGAQGVRVRATTEPGAPAAAAVATLETLAGSDVTSFSGGPRRPRAPFHVINTALNLTSGSELDWQERKAAVFTLTPLHAGSPVTGYRPMHDERGRFYGGRIGVSLGTAMAISGAAANPSMGCHSSPLVTFLLTLLNGRLGAWLGNPANERTFVHSYPGFRVLPMALLEAFGQTTARGKYVNLSDGGHVENLGLYELVRRRCRHIIVVDAAADEKYAFEDLGNAVRKIRVDLGVDIDIRGFRIQEPRPSKYLARGTIKYPGEEPGELLYVKPVVFNRDEPVDVQQYGKSHEPYPQEPTVDQFFSESQFESYRALGEHIALTVGGDTAGGNRQPPAGVQDFFKRADEYVAAAT